MQKMLEVSNDPNTISFSLGLPDPELFPTIECKRSINNILNSEVLQYAPPSSYLKQQIVKLMVSHNVNCKESQIFLTSGGQQGISLLARLLLDQGSTIITEYLTYPGFLQIVAPYAPKIIGIPTHFQKGPCLITLEKVLKNQNGKSAFIYLIPHGHNPLGISLNNTQKLQLAALSRYYQIPIIEDDAYGFLYYDMPETPLRAYEEEWVFYVGTFSKIIAPSLRVGWLIVPESLIPRLSFIKEALDINMATFTQYVIRDLLSRNFLAGHLNKLREVYKCRRDVMVKAINKYFPKNIIISEPQHGFFIWVELPPKLNVLNLFYKALEKNVAFMPGQAFFCNKEQAFPFLNGLRLNFSRCKPSLIETGIQKLGEIFKKSDTA